MALATVFSRAVDGIESPLVSVEVHVANGLPNFSVVGLPEKVVKESKERVRAALVNSQFDFPAKRVTVNLAPADLPKEGARYDLAIALGVLAATGQIPLNILEAHEFLGELALSGEIREVKGILPCVLAAKTAGRSLVIPLYNNREAAHVTGARIFAVSHLLEACHYLQGKTKLTPNPIESAYTHYVSRVDMNEVVGQFQARRALEIAAAGRHSVLMSGPPGTGKTMLASRLPGLLPPMSEKEAVETAAIHSVSHQGFHHSLWCERPYRNPHHTSSAVALVGGGSHPRPGEISLAHNGILFLDELPEFDRKVLEVLREPIESGYISISRAARKIRYPARFQLIAAMNPCPCGYFGDKKRSCSCSIEQVSRYRSRVSGPLMDRIDIQLQLQRLNQDEAINGNSMAESSEDIRKRVVAATHCQLARQGKVNSELGSLEIAKNCRISEKDQLFLNAALEKLQLSMRAYHRVLKLSRTIADLECETEIRTSHISEALGYRCLDRGLRA